MQSMDVDKDKTTILNCGLVFIYIHTLCVRAAKVLANFKMHKLIWVVEHAICDKISTDTYM